MLFREREVGALEAILFMAQENLSFNQLGNLLEIPADDVKELVDELKRRYDDPASGFMLVQSDEGIRLSTKKEFSRYIETMYKQPAQSLSNAALEVLSIVAYKQPVTKGEIEFLRGVQSDRAVATLLEKGLIKEVGRKDGPGRPILYGTTDQFLLHFGLQSISQLPVLKQETGLDEEEREMLELIQIETKTVSENKTGE